MFFNLTPMITATSKINHENYVYVDDTVGGRGISPLRKPNANDVYIQSKNKPKIIYRFVALLAICIAIFLTSCTGTTAETEPIFVIAGVQEDDNGASSILVLRDRIFEDLTDEQNPPRFVQSTSLQLAAPARAFDVVDEIGTREELVVLSRSQDPSTREVSAFLDFFNTRGLLADTPDTFRVSRTRIDLRSSSLIYPFPLTDLCPVDLEVNRAGTHAVIFNSPRVCNSNKLETDNVIVVLSIPRSGAVSVVSSLTQSNATNPLITSRITTGSQIPTSMFLDQSSDALYYLRRDVSQVTLRRLESGTYTTTTNPESDLSNNPPVAERVPISNDDFRDMTKFSSNIAILGTSSYVLAPLSFTTGFVPKITRTQSSRAQDPRAFVPDPSSSLFFILDDNDKLVYHADPTLETNTDTDIRGTVSTINTDSDFLYVAGRNADGNNLMSIVDLLPIINEGNTNLESLLSEEPCNAASLSDNNPNNDDGLCSLNNPTVLTWAKGILLPEEQ